MNYNKLKTKTMRMLLVLFFVTILPMAATAQEPYAVLSEDNTVLTFYYDNQKGSRGGMTATPPAWIYRGWNNSASNIIKVVFDDSFANCTTIKSTDGWFYECEKLTIIEGIGNLNTENVTDMDKMFKGCCSLKSLDLSGFNTSKVRTMEEMFKGCSGLTNLDLSNFDTGNVTIMTDMFSNCSSLTSLDLSHFNTSNVVRMGRMFSNCSSLMSLDLSHFNTCNVTEMWSVFSGCSSLTSLDVSHFDTGKASISNMFSGCSSLTSLDVSHFDTQNVKSFYGIFSGCSSLTSLDVSHFDTRNVTNMAYMFSGCSSLINLDLSNFDTGNVTEMTSMFYGCSGLASLDVSHFNTENVTDMPMLFEGCSSLTILDVRSFNTSKVTSMSAIFCGCSSLQTIYCNDTWNTENPEEPYNLFLFCTNLVGGKGSKYDIRHGSYDAAYAHPDGGPDNPGYFTYKEIVENACDLSDVPTDNPFYAATAFLCERTVLSGSKPDGKTDVSGKLLRSHLAKIAFRGLYLLNGRQVPETVPSDDFPTVYEDVAVPTEANEYYYRPAKALLYLEYGDGVTPFDRNRLNFGPEETISRVNVLKVLMETFNIAPDVEGNDNPFPNDPDVAAMAAKNPQRMGYVRRAAALGIITTTNDTFRPYDDCLRGEAFLMLARIMKLIERGDIADPNPQDDAYFQPLNTTLATIGLGVGLQMGNFQHYTKTGFALSGTVPLTFAHTYNSYNTTLPSVFYGDKSKTDEDDSYLPLGDGWSHNYHSFVTVVGEYVNNAEDDGLRVLVHWGGGGIDVYKKVNKRLVPESMGVYDDLEVEGQEVVIRSKSQVEYRFSKQGGTGATVLYLYSIKDRNGNMLTIDYEDGQNGSKRIKSVSDGHRALTFSYLGNTDLISEVKDPLKRSVRFTYFDNPQTGKKQLKTFTDAEGHTTTYDYAQGAGASKLLSRIQLPKGNYIENQYDANRRLNQTVSGVNGVPTTKTSVTVAANYGNGSVSTESTVDVLRGGEETTYHYTYNANNVMTALTGAEGLFTNRSYDSDEHPELPTAMESNSTTVSGISYDEKGNVTSVTVSGDGTLTTTMTYDDMNNLTSVTDPKHNTTTYTYDEKGNLTGVSAPEGVTSSVTVNDKGLPEEVRNAMGVKTQFAYNEYGNVTSVTLPALGLTSSATYDPASRLETVTDALQRTTTYAYNANDFLTSETDAQDHTTKYGYDANDNLTSITNAKDGVTTLTYDNATDWLTSVAFAGATKRYAYNEDGTLDTFTKPDGTTLNYTYDELGRVTNDGVNNYSYDDKLRLSEVSDGEKALTFEYDGFNRVTGTTYNGHSNSYGYDDNGNLTSLNGTTYTYDGLNRLKTVTFGSRTITYTYRKDSRLDKVAYPNGMTTQYVYDAVGRLTSKQTKLGNGTVIAGYNYTLDKVGNITEQTTQEPYGDIVLGNEDITYTYNAGNRITKAGDLSFEFDANGNTTKRGSEAYTWDKRDRLTQAGSTAITYDPLGLIASYGDITFTTSPLGIGNVLSDSKGAEYIYGNGLEARVKNGKVGYYVTDVRGSVVAIVDDNGNVTHKYQYDEFGKVTQRQETDYNPFQYVGKYGVMVLNDHQYYMRARHYDPTIGRFLSEDPIWSTNLYPYAENNSIMGIDPEGTYSYSMTYTKWRRKGLRFYKETRNYYMDWTDACLYYSVGSNMSQIDYYSLPEEVRKDFDYVLSNIGNYKYDGNWYKKNNKGEWTPINENDVDDRIHKVLTDEYDAKESTPSSTTNTDNNGNYFGSKKGTEGIEYDYYKYYPD